MAGNKWVAPSFGGDFNNLPKEIAPLNKKRRLTKEETQSIKRSTGNKFSCSKKNDCLPWFDLFSPRKKQDLAVHKKKIEDVEKWLLKKFEEIEKNLIKDCPMLLLTGPSGSGKTTTIKVLATEHNFDIREWEESSKLVNEWNLDGPELINQSSAFSNFLFRSSRYNSLFNEQKVAKRILLIEDIPSTFDKEMSVFHDILRKLKRKALCPVVFILSDTGSEDSQELKIFPKDLQKELEIFVIKFNPITDLSICKALVLILNEVKKQPGFVVASRNELELLALTANGDIRNAINTLQMLKSNLKNNGANKNPISQKSSKNILGKNPSLDLFHSIGKILYCKRDQNITEPKLPGHLKDQQRIPLVENPEDVFQRTAISSETFNLFLHENYLDFVIGLDRMSKCAHGFSDCDVLLHEWTTREFLSPYSSSIAIRSVMFNLNLPNDKRVNKVHPFKKPQWFDYKKAKTFPRKYVHSEFQNSHLALGKDLETLLIPYLALIRPLGLSSNQMSLAVKMSDFKNKAENIEFSTHPLKKETELISVRNDKEAADDYREFIIEEF